MTKIDPYSGDVTTFLHTHGAATNARWSSYISWINARRAAGVWPYWRTSLSVSADQMVLADEDGIGGVWSRFYKCSNNRRNESP